MNSIRFSLILYFLLLLGAALGGVAYFAYQSTQNALLAKERSTEQLLKKKLIEDKADIEAKFDSRVLEKCRALGPKIVLNYHRIEPLLILGVAASGPHSGGLWNLVSWAEAMQPALQPRTPLRLTQIDLDPRLQPLHGDDEHPAPNVVEDGEYFQTYVLAPFFKGDAPKKAEPYPHEASESLGGLIWKLTKEQKARADETVRKFEDVELKSGKKVRRLTMRFPVNYKRLGIAAPPIPPLTEKSYFLQMPPQTKDNIPMEKKGATWLVYLQYGLDTSDRDASLAKLRTDLDESLQQLRDESDEARGQLGQKLLWTSLGAFAALFLGGFWLVRVSLKPLDRLSEAVSRVSEKDFRLPIDQSHLPSELQPIAGRLAETLDQLKRVFEREKQAAADISHELRTPVAALITTLDITLRRERSADEYREVLEECRSSGRRMSQLVERLLTLARLDAGADILRAREVDVAALADQCVALVRPLAEARGLQLNLHNNGPASVHADPEKLREVLTNLLHNAIEYNKPNGSVDVNVQRNNGTLSLEVRDTGIGISPQAQKRVFERFYRVDPSRHADTPHAGLGLAIVKGFVDLMGGSIDLDSSVDTGTTFRVRLPVR